MEVEKRTRLKRGIFCIGFVVIEIIIYLSISMFIANKKEEEAKLEESTFRSQNEFLKTIDCAKIFDAYPDSSFEIRFEICGTKPGKVLVYQQNGVKSRYIFEQTINVTEEFEEVCLIVDPVLRDEGEEESYLAFYGEYGSGVIPIVRCISIVPQ